MTLRPKAIWRFGLPLLLVAGVAAAIAQQEWGSMLGAVALYGGFGAMAWRWRAEAVGRRLVLTRLRVTEFDLDDLDAAIEQVSPVRGFMRTLRLRARQDPERRAALLLYWWDGGRELADAVDADREGQWR